jgi:lipopolysaccharide/colanic/teichoic acid biosynthesis glycosyltransferase
MTALLNEPRLAPHRRKSDRKVGSARSRRTYRQFKNRFERFAAALLLVPVAPVLAVLWLLVKLTSRGPGIYRQKRVGLGGRQFQILKLRTMTHDCEAQTGAVWSARNDSRVTLLGKIMRKTHLDELPQLVNVVRGEMSFVGPRPERPEIIKKLLSKVPAYLDRIAISPGVTGLAQVCAGPDETIADVQRKMGFDLAYMEAESFWLDLRIILCTVLKMVGTSHEWMASFFFPGFVGIGSAAPHHHVDRAPLHAEAVLT